MKLFNRKSYVLSRISHFKKARRKVFFITLPILIIFGPIVAYLILNAKPAQADWFNNNWLYRQPITVTNSTGSAVSNLQKLFTINTSTLVSAGKLQSNCYDLRFTDQTGTSLPYYIDSGCNTTTTKVWVLISSLPTNTSTIYMYYGNPTAIQGSNSAQFQNVVNLKGYWTENDGSGTTAADSSINGNTMTLQGTTDLPTWNASGKYGSDISFDGTDDHLNMSTAPLTSTTGNITLEAWVYPSTTNQAGMFVQDGGPTGGFGMEIDNGGGGAGDYFTYISRGIGFMNSGYQFPSANTWYHVAVTDDGTNVRFYVNGHLVAGPIARMSVNTVDTSQSNIGVFTNGSYSRWFAGQIDDVRMYNAARTASQIANDYQNVYTIQTAGLNITYSFGSETQAPGPVAYWKFDEGTGTTAYDSTGQGNNGTLSGSTLPQWEPKSQCVSGKCLYFNGSSSYINIPNSSSLNPLNAVTVSAWIKMISYPSATTAVITKDNPSQGPYHFTIGTNGVLGMDVYTTSGWHSASITTPLNTNQWYFVTGVYDGTTTYVYVNGVLTASASGTSGTLQSNTNNVKIGWAPYTNGFFNGFIDEPKIYNYARSANQIQADYFNTLKGSGAVLGAATNQNLSNGLVAYYKMDESTTGTTYDSSGNSNNGTDTGTTVVSGKFGNARNFNGSSYSKSGVNNFPTGSAARSVFAWVYSTSYPSQWSMVDAFGTNGTGQDSGLSINGSGNIYFNGNGDDYNSGFTLPTNSWHFIGYTYTTGSSQVTVWYDGKSSTGSISQILNTASNIQCIGGWSAGSSCVYPWNGNVDEVRVYNRALSPSEVSQLYNYAPGPVAYYNFNEGTGNTVHDTSGNNNTGTWSGSGSHWTVGKYGDAGNFNGTNDYVNVPNSSSFNQNGNITIDYWIKPKQITSGFNYVFLKGTDFDNVINSTGVNFYLKLNGTRTYLGIIAVPWNKWSHVAYTYNGSVATLYLNGVAQSTSTQNLPLTATSNSNFTFSGPGYWYNGAIDDFKVYNYSRTQKQIVQDMNGGHPAGGSPIGSQVGYWKFDEGYGTIAHNSGNQGSALDGTISGATWTNSGKYGRALSFNGSSGYVDIPNSAALNPSQITMTAWIKANSLGGRVIDKITVSGSDGYMMDTYQNKLRICATSCASSNDTLPTGQWVYLAITFDGINTNFYINGKLDTTSTAITSIPSNTHDLRIGADQTGATVFNGIIDDVKVYSSALTASQIAIDYNHNTASVMGATGTDSSGNPSNSADRAYCPPGDTTATCAPAGEWNFNEGQGTTVNDTSGNGNTGTWNGSGPNHWAIGKVGYAGNFNGTDDYVLVNNPTISGSAITMESWVYLNSLSSNNTIFINSNGSNNTYQMYIWPSGLIEVDIGTGSGFWIVVGRTTTGLINQTHKWYHIVGEWSSGNGIIVYVNNIPYSVTYAVGSSTTTGSYSTGGPLYIGRAPGGSYMNGQIDQAKIYNYARTPAEIAYDYNGGKPIAEWQFDECQGTIAHDLSGNGNNGTITIGGSGAQTQPGTCYDGLSSSAWYNGVNGKIGHSISLDGTDDYINVPDNSTLDTINNVSVSAWVYPTSISQGSYGGGVGGTIIDRNENGSTSGYDVGIRNNGTIWWWPQSGQDKFSTGTIPLNTWSHIVITYTNGTVDIYINGKLDSSQSSVAPQSTTNPLKIGSESWITGYFKGQIDDVRIYNYALTPLQVQTLYNNGAVSF